MPGDSRHGDGVGPEATLSCGQLSRLRRVEAKLRPLVHNDDFGVVDRSISLNDLIIRLEELSSSLADSALQHAQSLGSSTPESSHARIEANAASDDDAEVDYTLLSRGSQPLSFFAASLRMDDLPWNKNDSAEGADTSEDVSTEKPPLSPLDRPPSRVSTASAQDSAAVDRNSTGAPDSPLPALAALPQLNIDMKRDSDGHIDADTATGSTHSGSIHSRRNDGRHVSVLEPPPVLENPVPKLMDGSTAEYKYGADEAELGMRDYERLFHAEQCEASPFDPPLLQAVSGEYYMPGDVHRRWHLGKVIGRGGSSTVKLATEAHDPRGREVAVKIISKKSPNYDERSVAREIFICRLMTNVGGDDHVCSLYEVFEDKTHVYLVMECLTGGQLLDVITGVDRIAERRAAVLTAAMLKSINFCHRLNIVHRDLKPANFVFSHPDTETAVLKLTDFGISFYSADPDILCKTLVGTPLYVAPEVLLRQLYGPEADMWSLGVIVHLMLVGYPPFDDQLPQKLVRSIKFQNVLFDGAGWILVSENAKDFVRQLLEKDPMDRLTAERALQHPWLVDVEETDVTHSQLMLANVRLNINSYLARRRWKYTILAVVCLARLTNRNLRSVREVVMPPAGALMSDYKRVHSIRKMPSAASSYKKRMMNHIISHSTADARGAPTSPGTPDDAAAAAANRPERRVATRERRGPPLNRRDVEAKAHTVLRKAASSSPRDGTASQESSVSSSGERSRHRSSRFLDKFKRKGRDGEL